MSDWKDSRNDSKGGVGEIKRRKQTDQLLDKAGWTGRAEANEIFYVTTKIATLKSL